MEANPPQRRGGRDCMVVGCGGKAFCAIFPGMRKTLRPTFLALLTLPCLALAGDGAAKGGHEGHAHGEEAECHHPPQAKATATDGWTLTRGDKLQGAPAVTLAELLARPQAHQGKTVLLEGQVRQACQRRGCWMELAEGAKGPGVRVTFKDYGFFVPPDSAGAQARVEGVVELAELSDKAAQHYESEGAQVTRGPDGKAREVRLVARGVELRR
jgi:hypothetical protein